MLVRLPVELRQRFPHHVELRLAVTLEHLRNVWRNSYSEKCAASGSTAHCRVRLEPAAKLHSVRHRHRDAVHRLGIRQMYDSVLRSTCSFRIKMR